MARIILNIKQKTPLSIAKVELRVEYGNKDTTAERNLMIRLADTLCDSWNIGKVSRPPEPAVPNLDRITRKEPPA